MAAVSAGYLNKIPLEEERPWNAVKNGYAKFTNGDVLIAKITPCFQNRKSAIANNLISGIGCGSSEFHVLRSNESVVDRKYLFLFAKSSWFISYGVENFKGTAGQQRLGTLELRNCRFHLPPILEQQRIVEKVKRLFEQIDRAEKAYKELSGPLSARFCQLCLEKAIHGKLVPQLEKEPFVAQIGEQPHNVPFTVPDKWKWVQLRAVGKIVGGGTPRTNIPEYWENGVIPWYTPADLGKVTSIYVGTSSRRITAKGLANSSAIMIPKNTVLFSSRAPIGYIALATENCCTNQGCKSFVANESVILPMWAYWVLTARTPDIVSRASGTTFKEISGRGMGDTWIPLPPMAEQKRIVAKIQELFDIAKVILFR